MKQTFIIALSVFTIFSCKESKTVTSEDSKTVINQTEVKVEKSTDLALNNNEKWLVNKEMKPFVMKGEELVNTYIESNKSDYKELANQLKMQNDQLIQSCTMKGASHDELHKWLHPHLEIVASLNNTVDVETAKPIIQNLANSYEMYHQYFN